VGPVTILSPAPLLTICPQSTQPHCHCGRLGSLLPSASGESCPYIALGGGSQQRSTAITLWPSPMQLVTLPRPICSLVRPKNKNHTLQTVKTGGTHVHSPGGCPHVHMQSQTQPTHCTTHYCHWIRSSSLQDKVLIP
jgi:hypothetical protein